MLVCNVSLRPPRRAIAAEIAEAAAAEDGTTTGVVVFATLVDDPASVNEIVDAYLGSIMLEEASADTVLDATIPVVITAAIVETMTAADTHDGTITTPAAVSWNPSDKDTYVTLSGGNLIAAAGGPVVSQGAVRAISGYSSGKYYWEETVDIWASGNTGVGIALSSANLSTVPTNPVGAAILYQGGTIYVNGSYSGVSMGARTAGQIIGIAIDVSAKLIWFRVAPSGNWNNSGTANPATGTGGISFSALVGAVYPLAAFNLVGDQITANFGGSAFSGTMPSGFSAPP